MATIDSVTVSFRRRAFMVEGVSFEPIRLDAAEMLGFTLSPELAASIEFTIEMAPWQAATVCALVGIPIPPGLMEAVETLAYAEDRMRTPWWRRWLRHLKEGADENGT